MIEKAREVDEAIKDDDINEKDKMKVIEAYERWKLSELIKRLFFIFLSVEIATAVVVEGLRSEFMLPGIGSLTAVCVLFMEYSMIIRSLYRCMYISAIGTKDYLVISIVKKQKIHMFEMFNVRVILFSSLTVLTIINYFLFDILFNILL